MRYKLKQIKSFAFNHRIISLMILTLMISGIAGGVIYAFIEGKPVQPATEVTVELEPEPATKPTPKSKSLLTGLQLNNVKTNSPVISVIIENSTAARPQAGLQAAEVVVEAEAEGGITRFLALFQDRQPGLIGPIRSARPYFLDFVVAFDAALGHVGGSGEALNQIPQLGITDLDEFANSGSYYRRSDRYAPHNVYTSFESLLALTKAKAQKTSKIQPGLEFGKVSSFSDSATEVNLAALSAEYQASWVYKSGKYHRLTGGQKHLDENTNQQIDKTNIIVLTTEKSYITNYGHVSYRLTGKGRADAFIGGKHYQLQWQRNSRTSGLRLIDPKTNANFKLKAGQSWITLNQDQAFLSWE